MLLVGDFWVLHYYFGFVFWLALLISFFGCVVGLWFTCIALIVLNNIGALCRVFALLLVIALILVV